MTTLFENTKIHYTSQGAGNPIVLLHGFLESSIIWNDFVAQFSNTRQIITLDFPGHGKSPCLPEEVSMEKLAAVVHHVLQVLKVEKADFMGHSMGGYVLMAFLEKHPLMVEKVILLDSTPQGDSDERKINRDRSIALVEQNKSAFVKMSISNLLSPGNSKSFSEELQILKNDASNFPTKGIVQFLEAMKIRRDRTSILEVFTGEKFILAGREDPLISYQKINNLAKICNCKLIPLSGGHLSYLEDQKELFKTMHFIE